MPEGGDGLVQFMRREVRPQYVREVKLRICALPQQEVRYPLLSAGADQQIGVGDTGGIEVVGELLLGQLAVRPALGDVARVAFRGVDYLVAPAVIEADVRLKALVALGNLVGLGD